MSDATVSRRKRQPAATEAPQPAAPVRFSAPNLIGETGLVPAVGARVRVSGSKANDGVFEVRYAAEDWIAVHPHIADEAPIACVVEIVA